MMTTGPLMSDLIAYAQHKNMATDGATWQLIDRHGHWQRGRHEGQCVDGTYVAYEFAYFDCVGTGFFVWIGQCPQCQIIYYHIQWEGE